MERIKPAKIENDSYGYVLVESPDGVLRCSCGRQLVKKDEFTWACSAGWPMYRVDKDEVRLDKFGNMYLKGKPHGDRGGRE